MTYTVLTNQCVISEYFTPSVLSLQYINRWLLSRTLCFTSSSNHIADCWLLPRIFTLSLIEVWGEVKMRTCRKMWFSCRLHQDICVSYLTTKMSIMAHTETHTWLFSESKGGVLATPMRCSITWSRCSKVEELSEECFWKQKASRCFHNDQSYWAHLVTEYRIHTWLVGGNKNYAHEWVSCCHHFDSWNFCTYRDSK